MAVIIKLPNKKQPKPTLEDVQGMAGKLSKGSSLAQIVPVLKAIAQGEFDPLEKEIAVKAVQNKTQLTKTALKNQIAKYEMELGMKPNDLSLEVARRIRDEQFAAGAHLVRSTDGSLWRFNETHWWPFADENLRKMILPEANDALPAAGTKSITAFTSQIQTCLMDVLGVEESFSAFNANPSPVINCLNGELWIKKDGSFELRPHCPESRLTYCLPINYNPDAKCPLYDAALLDIFAKSDNPIDMARHFNEFFGYAIQPERDIPSYWLLIGHGANGKSTLLKTMQRLMGPDAVVADQIAGFQRDRFKLAGLFGKLALIDDDMTDGTLLNDGLLKKISENKEITARLPYGCRDFNFCCQALPVMAANNYPLTKDISHGMIRRAQVIPFDRTFTSDDKDPTLFPKIWEAEMPGILNRALEGLKRLRIRGDLKLPTDCERAKAEFLCHANPLMGFMKDHCIDDPKGRTKVKDFRDTMRGWALDQGIKTPPPGNALKRKLEGLFYKVSKVNGYNTVFGLSLSVTPLSEDDEIAT